MVGQYKDDRLQEHRHFMYTDVSGGNIWASDKLTIKNGEVNYSSGVGPVSFGRTGATTRCKSKGVKFMVKVL